MYSEELYTDYFEGLARSLADINHTDAKEHFFINNETGNGLKELESAVGGRLRLPALVLDEPELDTDGSSSGQKIKITGGFVILAKFDPSNFRSFRPARLKTQQIARKIINKMKRDSRTYFDEDSPLLAAHAIQVGEIHQYPTPIILKEYLGWAVEFQWIVADDINFGSSDFYSE